MADETSVTGPAGGSKNEAPKPVLPPAAPHLTPAPEPEAHPVRERVSDNPPAFAGGNDKTPSREASQDDLSNGARIVEEIIIKPPPHPKEVAPPTPAPGGDAPVVENIPAQVVQKALDPQPPSPTLAPAPLPPQDPQPAEKKLVEPGKELPAHTAENTEREREAITRILEEAKLPERRDPPSSEKAPEQKELKTFDTILGAVVEPPKEKGEELPRPAQPPPSGGGLVSAIVAPFRTLKNDLQEIVRVKKISLVRAAALEQEKRRGPIDPALAGAQTRSRRTSAILFAALILVILGGAAFFGVSIIMQERSGTPVSEADTPILFAESATSLPLKSDSPLDLKRLLAQARVSWSATLGSITRIVPTVPETNADGATLERSATLEEFLRALGARTPLDLVRALSQEFFFGIHTVDENAPLFVVPVLSYERAFAGMLEWEQTMNADLAPVFTPVPPQILGPGGLPEKRQFEDVVMRNYDVRALKDNNGEIQLYYSFPTRSLLVIGESPYSFTEILSRLRAERRL